MLHQPSRVLTEKSMMNNASKLAMNSKCLITEGKGMNFQLIISYYIK